MILIIFLCGHRALWQVVLVVMNCFVKDLSSADIYACNVSWSVFFYSALSIIVLSSVCIHVVFVTCRKHTFIHTNCCYLKYFTFKCILLPGCDK